MCGPMIAMAGMAGVSMLGARAGQKDQAKLLGDQIAAQNASKVSQIKQMNYDIVSANQEQRDAYDQAVTQLTNNSINSIRNQGMIEAAFGESGVEGRSVDMVLREVRGQDASVADSIKGNFEKQAASNQYNKEMIVMNTDSSIKGMPTIRGPSSFTSTMQILGAGLQGASTGANMYGMSTKLTGGTSGNSK